jgi:hypothetical protein
MHSIEYNYALTAFTNTWHKSSDRNTGHALRNNNDNALPLPRIGLKKLPLYSLPAAWNAAGNVRLQQNKTTFIIALKDKLLSEIEPDPNNLIQ